MHPPPLRRCGLLSQADTADKVAIITVSDINHGALGGRTGGRAGSVPDINSAWREASCRGEWTGVDSRTGSPGCGGLAKVPFTCLESPQLQEVN